ncbi:MAG: PEP/pyruvate-binding domain-containing protein [Desulfovibrionaceae bacterium]
MGFLQYLKERFLGSRRTSALGADALRDIFSRRYHAFKVLISANNKALEIMASMEETLRGTQPYGMDYVQAQAARLSAAVFQIVRQMHILAPGGYPALDTRFAAIHAAILRPLAQDAHEEDGPLVLPVDALDRTNVDQAGAKMAFLGALRGMGIATPDGFVVTARAFRLFMAHNGLQEEINRRIQVAEGDDTAALYAVSSAVQNLILAAPLPEALQGAMIEALQNLGGDNILDLRLAVRSSALGEDMPGLSFAGQYRSQLNVSPEHFFQAYREVVASKFGPQAMAYRLHRGVPDEAVAMCVGVLRMVDAVAGGVAYSRDPMDVRGDTVCVHAVSGLPKGVVDGAMASDLYVFSRQDGLHLIRRDIATKRERVVALAGEGVSTTTVAEDDALHPALNNDQARELARLCVQLEERLGAPQDMEWALDAQGELTVLQARPLSLAAETRMPRGGHVPDSAHPLLLQGGVTAAPGAGAGPVYVVEKDVQALGFPKGAVLVLARPSPRWAPLLPRAAAVVAETGGAAVHLANVAREFGVPALFGAPGALQTLRTGDEVTVDADTRCVHPGRIEAILAAAKRPTGGFMQGSPVHAALVEALEHIAPLNLTDPDSILFRAANCETLHDITRFCHEKAVEAMFHMTDGDGFPIGSAKQLYTGTATQFWVLDLDNGFKDADPASRFVLLEQVVSTPMRILWEGITAIPWEGPPSLDARGFMSVLMEASANPALDPSMASPYTTRNYFMVARDFCSLQARFGFHFCSMEALAGEHPAENYCAFRFSGGAADHDRRAARVAFISGLLRGYGFRVAVTGDTLAARLEGVELAAMRPPLIVLGYMITHTRQLDMVMADPSAVSRLRDKFLRDLSGLLAGGTPNSATA